MKFKFGDNVIVKDEFAKYKGRVTAHKTKIKWPFFWKKVSWYLVAISMVNQEYLSGTMFVPENELAHEDEAKIKRAQFREIKGDE